MEMDQTRRAGATVDWATEDEYWRQNYASRPTSVRIAITSAGVRRIAMGSNRPSGMATGGGRRSSPISAADGIGANTGAISVRHGNRSRMPCATRGTV